MRTPVAVSVLLLAAATAAAESPAVDRLGDPLPDHALARIGSTRLRHGGFIEAVAMSPDGRLIASRGHDKVVRVWEVATGRQVREFPAPQWGAYALTFSPDGKRLAMAVQTVLAVARSEGSKETGSFVCWDVTTGREVERLEGFRGVGPGGRARNALAWKADGRRLIAETDDDNLRVYDPADPKTARTLHGVPRIIRLFITADGGLITAIGEDDRAHIWDAVTGRKRSSSALVWAVDDNWAAVKQQFALSPEGNRLASAFANGTIHVCDLRTGRQPVRIAGTGPLSVLEFAPDGHTLIGSSTAGANVRIWDTAAAEELTPITKPSAPLASFALSPDGKTAAAVDRDRKLHLYDLAAGRETYSRPAGAVSITFASEGRLYFVDEDNFIAALDLRQPAPKAIRALPDRIQTVFGLAVSPDGKHLAASCIGSSWAKVWDIPSGQRRFQFGSGLPIGSDYLCFSPDGRTIVSLSNSQYGAGRRPLPAGRLGLWNADTGASLSPTTELANTAYAVAFHPNGRAIAAQHLFEGAELVDRFNRARFGQDQPARQVTDTVRLWTAKGDHEIRRFGEGTGISALKPTNSNNVARPVCPMSFSPDGRTLAIVEGSEVTLLETLSGTPRLRLSGHVSAIRGMKFTTDGRTLVTGSEDSTVLVWDVAGDRRRDSPALPVDQLWRSLAAVDAMAAETAMRGLLVKPAETIKWLHANLRPVTLDENRVKRWLAELDSPKFAEREAAFEHLEALGNMVENALQRARASHPSPEARARLDKLLARAKLAVPAPVHLQALRAIELLERIGSQEARKLLGELAGGDRDASMTRESAASLKRLESR
ncbi:MAG: WD40 repeat domain-containing protein [Gemmataceae bacterium]